MQPVDQVTLTGIVHAATTDVFATMLEMELTPQAPYVQHVPPPPTEGVVSLIGLAGKWVGTGSVFCSAPFACQISSRMLMADFCAVNDEVLDAVAEVTNMVLGNVKTGLEEHLGPMGLSIPTVVYGKNFTAKTAGDGDWNVFPFTCDGELLEVKIHLAPNRKPIERIRHGFSHPYSLQG